MNEYLIIFNICLLFVLLLLYICSIIFEIYYLIKDKILKILFYFLIFDIIITSITIFITLLLGISSLYYSSKDKIYIYVIILFFFIFEKIFSIIILYKKGDINFTYSIKDIIFYIISFQIILLIINFISCLIQRKQIIKEIKEAPLNYVDQNITEDIYNNILTQSLNPDDKKLKVDFKKKIELRKNASSRFSSSTLKSK